MNKAKLYFNKNNNFITIKLADVLEEYYEKANKNSKFEHVSLTKEGVVPKTERYNRDFLVKDTNKLYRVTHLNDICYNPANLKFGVICRNTYKDGIFSPIYITFKVSEKVLPNYIEYLITREDFINRALKYQQGTVFERMSVSPIDLCSIEINIPNIEEQQKISTFLAAFDLKIEHESQIIEQLKQLKKSLLYKMFPIENSNVPELRFKGFTETWEQRKLGELMNVTSVKRIHQSDWTSSGVRFLRARDIVSEAKNEEPDDYLYISEEKYIEYSAISGKVQVGDLLVTGVGTIGIPLLIRNSEPLYFKDGNIIWFQNNNVINGNFLYYSFWGKQIQDYISESAGIGTVGTYTIDSGKKTPISLPSISEQSKIGRYFVELDNLITLHQCKYDKLVQVKKALLSKMFV